MYILCSFVCNYMSIKAPTSALLPILVSVTNVTLNKMNNYYGKKQSLDSLQNTKFYRVIVILFRNLFTLYFFCSFQHQHQEESVSKSEEKEISILNSCHGTLACFPRNGSKVKKVRLAAEFQYINILLLCLIIQQI